MSKKIVLPSISFIVARSNPGNVIGCENGLPWHLKSDLVRFRKITSHHAVIMGRKTYESIGKILPNRLNIVLTREGGFDNKPPLSLDENTLFITNNQSNAMFFADLFSIFHNKSEFFIIGGAEIYKMFGEIVNKVHLTEVFSEVKGDAYFHHKFDVKRNWRLLREEDFSASDSDQFGSRYIEYERRDRRYRYTFLEKFFTEQGEKSEWIANQVRNNRKSVESYISEHGVGPAQGVLPF